MHHNIEEVLSTSTNDECIHNTSFKLGLNYAVGLTQLGVFAFVATHNTSFVHFLKLDTWCNDKFISGFVNIKITFGVLLFLALLLIISTYLNWSRLLKTSLTITDYCSLINQLSLVTLLWNICSPRNINIIHIANM